MSLPAKLQVPAVDLYNADFCPFGERAWIALLEKGIPFNYIYVNYFHKAHPNTQKLYELNPGRTVPVVVTVDKEVAYDSFQLIEYLDDKFPENQLRPDKAQQIFQMRVLIQGYSENVIGPFYGFLMNTNPDLEETKKNNYIKGLTWLNENLNKYNQNGPYALGEKFTTADICMIPFINRAIVLLSFYKGFEISKEFERVHQWREACMKRESLKIVNADRLPESLKALPQFLSQDRELFLREVYSIYAANQVQGSKDLIEERFEKGEPWSQTFDKFLIEKGWLKKPIEG